MSAGFAPDVSEDLLYQVLCILFMFEHVVALCI